MATYRIRTRTGDEYYVDAADDASRDDILGALRTQLEPPAPRQEAPVKTPEDDFSFMDYVPPEEVSNWGLLKKGVARNWEQTKSLLGDVAPAALASAVGADEYAKRQMEEAQAVQEEIARTNPPRYSSISDIQDVGDIPPFAAESLGENLITGATMLLPAGAGATIGSRLATGAAERALAGTAERRLAAEAAQEVAPRMTTEAAASRLAETEAGKRLLGQAASRGAGTGSMVGLATGVFPTDIADTFQNIYEKTGKLAPEEAFIGGALVGLLDMYSPASVVNAFRKVPGLKAEVAAKIAAGQGLKAGVIPFAKALAVGSVKGIAREVPTEMAQEEISILAEQIAGDLQARVGPEEINRILTAGAKAAAPGAAFGVIEGAGARSRELGETQRQEAAALPQEPEAPPVNESANRAAELDALNTQISDLQGQIDQAKTTLDANVKDKRAQYEYSQLNRQLKDLIDKQDELTLTPEQLEAKKAQKGQVTLPDKLESYTGEDMLNVLGMSYKEAKKVLAANNLQINFKKPVTGSAAENFVKFLDAVQPDDVRDIGRLKDETLRAPLVDDFIKRVELLRDNHPNLTPEAIRVGKIADIKSNKFGAAFNEILAGRPLDLSKPQVLDSVYSDLVAKRDEALAAGNIEFASFIDNRLRKNTFLQEAAAKAKEGEVQAPTAGAKRVEPTPVTEEPTPPPTPKVAPNDYVRIEQEQSREAALDRLTRTLYETHKDKTAEDFRDRLNKPTFGTRADQFGSYKEEATPELKPREGKEGIPGFHGVQEEPTIAQEGRQYSYGKEAQAFYNSLTPEEQQAVKDKAVALRETEPDVEAIRGPKRETDLSRLVAKSEEDAAKVESIQAELDDIAEQAAKLEGREDTESRKGLEQLDKRSAQLRGILKNLVQVEAAPEAAEAPRIIPKPERRRLNQIKSKISALEKEDATKNAKQIAALKQEALGINSEAVRRTRTAAPVADPQREYNKLYRELRDKELSLEEAETDAAKQKLADRVDTIQNRLDELKQTNPDLKEPSRFELSVGEEAAAPATPESARAALERKMGRDVEKVTITNTPEEAGLKGIPKTAKGAVVNGKAHLFTQNIEAGNEFGTFLHEVGNHLGMKRLVGEGNHAFLINKVQEWAGKDGDALEMRIARAAMARIPEGTKASDEALAYFVEEAVDNFGVNPSQIRDTATPLGMFFRKIMAGVKNILSKIGLAPKDLTAQDLVDLAYGAAHMELERGVSEPGAQVQYSLKEASENPLTTLTPRKRGTDEETRATLNNPDLLTEFASNSNEIYDKVMNWTDSQIKKVPKWGGQGMLEGARDFLESSTAPSIKNIFLRLRDMQQLAELAALYSPEKRGGTLEERQQSLEGIIREIDRNVRDSDYALSKKMKGITDFLQESRELTHKFSPKQMKDFGRLFHASTVNLIDYADPVNANNLLVKEFKKQDPALQKLHFDLYKKYQSYRDKQLEYLNNEKVLGTAGKLMANLLKREIKPYAPLYRGGDFWLEFENPETKKTDIVAFQTEALRREAIQYLKSKGVKAKQFARVQNVTVESLPPTGEVRKIIGLLKKNNVDSGVINNVYQIYLNLFPNSSIMQNFRPRKGVAGFEEDPLLVFANVAPRMERSLERPELTKKLDSLMGYAKGIVGRHPPAPVAQLMENLDARVSFFRNPVDNGPLGQIAARSGQLSYYYFLWGNVSSALVQTMNLPVVAYPMLGGKYGFDTTYSELMKAAGLWWRGGRDDNTSTPNPFTGRIMQDKSIFGDKSKLSKDEYDLYETAVGRVLKPAIGHELDNFRDGKLSDVSTKATQVAYWGGWAFQNTERAMREMTLLATYRMARKGNAATGVKPLSHADAVEEAIRMTEKVNGSVSSKVGPEFFQKGIGKVIGTFKRIQLAMIYLSYQNFKQAFFDANPEVRRIAKRQFAGINLMAFTFAGLQGVPIYGAASLISSLAASMFGDKDEPPFDLNRKLLSTLGPVFVDGPVSALSGADIGGRSPFSNLLFRSDEKLLADVGPFLYAVQQAAGPFGGIFQNLNRGVELYKQGYTYRALEAVTPSVAKNVLKGIRLEMEGATNPRGYKLVDDLFALDSAYQVVGFTPYDISQAYTKSKYIAKDVTFAADHRSDILRRANMARFAGDMEEYRRIKREDMRNFNRSDLGRKNPLNESSFEKSYKQWNHRINQSLYGYPTPDKYRQAAIEEFGNMKN